MTEGACVPGAGLPATGVPVCSVGVCTCVCWGNNGYCVGVRCSIVLHFHRNVFSYFQPQLALGSSLHSNRNKAIGC